MPFKLRLSASEWRFALTSFAAKVGLFWLSELVICQWDQERWVCNVVGKVLSPA
ncbi:putative membrane protein [Synechococcus sp. M16.1]|nr:putative membrane protein [Synechococcus sp. M16.1]